jgi:hypothetical protein
VINEAEMPMRFSTSEHREDGIDVRLEGAMRLDDF